MKPLQVAILAGVILAGTVSAGAQSILRGAQFEVAEEGGTVIEGVAQFHAVTIEGGESSWWGHIRGAYWSREVLYQEEIGYSPTVYGFPLYSSFRYTRYSPTYYVEVPLSHRSSFAIARGMLKLEVYVMTGFSRSSPACCPIYNWVTLSVDVPALDVFYAWTEGDQTYFSCAPTIRLRPTGILSGIEVLLGEEITDLSRPQLLAAVTR